MINFHRRTSRRRRGRGQRRNDSRTCSIEIFDIEQASYSSSESPSVAESTTAATASRSDIHDDDTLSASTVIGTGQTGSPLAEPEVEEDLFLKTVAK